MGAAWIRSMSVAGHLGELVGFKAGLALTREELGEHLTEIPYIRDLVLETDDRLVRVRSEEYEAAVCWLLYQVGNIPTPWPMPPVTAVHRRFENDPTHSKVLWEVIDRCIELIKDQFNNNPNRTPLNGNRLIEAIALEFGLPGITVAKALLDEFALQIQISPWVSGRWFDWDDEVELRDLFRSESLETRYGTFFDQRFVYYLARNFQRIDDINWRKFEGLTGEFFERKGYQVAMGPGRKDGGVDVRVWASADDVVNPPLILVQCKRQRTKVDQVIVKALWADVSDERAQSGLIVTTSALTPGAETMRQARGYPINAIDRQKLQGWIEKLRSPGVGTFLA